MTTTCLLTTETLMNYLTSRRLSSIENLALHFHVSYEQIMPMVWQLASQKRLRYAVSHCQSQCVSCSGCPSYDSATVLNGNTILISLEKQELDL